MATPKLQVGRALEVIPSADCEIPFPNMIVSGLASSAATSQLIDNTVDFIALNVSVGDVVYNRTTPLGATVTNIIDANTLELNADIFSVSDSYEIYVGGENNGCVFHISSNDPTDTFQCNIKTIGGDLISKLYLSSGYHPIQIKRFDAISSPSGNYKIIALW
jgi:hypothetical protein